MTKLRSLIAWIGRSAKRIVVTVVGFGLIVAGLIMLVVPGPGILAIIAGLAVLATQYAWARRALDVTKRRAGSGWDRLRRGR